MDGSVNQLCQIARQFVTKRKTDKHKKPYGVGL